MKDISKKPIKFSKKELNNLEKLALDTCVDAKMCLKELKENKLLPCGDCPLKTIIKLKELVKLTCKKK